MRLPLACIIGQNKETAGTNGCQQACGSQEAGLRIQVLAIRVQRADNHQVVLVFGKFTDLGIVENPLGCNS